MKEPKADFEQEKEYVLGKWGQLKLFVLEHPLLSKYICIALGIYFLIESYSPAVSYAFRIFVGSSINAMSFVISCSFFFLAYLIHHRRWPEDNRRSLR